MKKFPSLFLACTITFGGLLSAHADTVLLFGSYGTTASNPGVGNSATTYDSAASQVNNGSTSTFDISPGTVWHAPTGTSSWVSFDPNTGPTSTLVVPNGDYIYHTTFTLGPSDVTDTGTLTVLADDTLSVSLNGTLILPAAGPKGSGNTYSMCSDVAPNCLTPLTFNFTGFQSGSNTLTFDVKQVNLVNEGLDYSGGVFSAIPEPLPLALLGTGLLGLVAGLFRRRFASK